VEKAGEAVERTSGAQERKCVRTETLPSRWARRNWRFAVQIAFVVIAGFAGTPTYTGP